MEFIHINQASAVNGLCETFHIFINLYSNQPYFVHIGAAKLQSYIENADNNIMEYELLKQLLGE